MGLFIVKTLVELLSPDDDNTIKVESKYNKGSSFSFFIRD